MEYKCFKDFKGIIFDFDGTLADSLDVWADIDINFAKKRGLSLPKDYFLRVSAMNLPEAAVYTKEIYKLADTPEQIMNEWYEMAVMEYSQKVRFKPYALDFVKAIKNLGSPADIAKQILKENEKPETSAIPAVNDSTKASKRKKDGKDILLTILLLIITFPIWIALLSIAFALVVTLFSVALALIISLIAGSVAMLVGGIILLFTSAPFGIMCIGIGLCMLGLFILLLSPLFSLIIKACKLLVESIKNLIARFSAKREV